MMRSLGFYLNFRISHNFPRKIRPKMVPPPQEERGDDLPSHKKLKTSEIKYNVFSNHYFAGVVLRW